jgi:hypothetical protein
MLINRVNNRLITVNKCKPRFDVLINKSRGWFNALLDGQAISRAQSCLSVTESLNTKGP